MPSSLNISAVEESTIVITASFTDEDSQAVSPNTLKWTLTDNSGNIINDRNQVEISSPSSSEKIVLSGLDLAVIGNEDAVREFTIEATYNSDLGADLPLKDSVRFRIEQLIAVPNALNINIYETMAITENITISIS